MNIYVLDADPVLCAQYHCDKDLCTVGLWYTDILHAANLFTNGGPQPKHVLGRWASGSQGFWWLANLARACLDEQLLKYKLPGDAVAAYRQHYLRSRVAESWTKRGAPGWWGNAGQQLALRF